MSVWILCTCELQPWLESSDTPLRGTAVALAIAAPKHRSPVQSELKHTASNTALSEFQLESHSSPHLPALMMLDPSFSRFQSIRRNSQSRFLSADPAQACFTM